MAKDYAQRNKGGRRQARPASPRSASRNGPRNGMPWWVGVVLGLSIGLAIAVIVYIARPASSSSKQGRPDAAATASDNNGKLNPQQTRAALAGKKNVIKLPPKEKTRFTFYELLPSQEVVVPREQVQSASNNTSASDDDGLYLIQVASYRTQRDADALKAKLALLGIESRIEKVTIDNKDTYFRVRIGPEKSLASVHTITARLDSNNIESLVVKVK